MYYLIRTCIGWIPVVLAWWLLSARSLNVLASTLSAVAFLTMLIRPAAAISPAGRRSTRNRIPEKNKGTSHIAAGLVSGFLACLMLLSVVGYQIYLPQLTQWWNRERVETEQQAATAHVDSLVESSLATWSDPLTAGRFLDRGKSLNDAFHLQHKALLEHSSKWRGPRMLSSDTVVTIVKQSSQPPIWSADVAVTDRGGQSIAGLSTTDFRLLTHSRKVKPFVLEELNTPRSQLQLAIAIDCSASTTGEPHAQAVEGVCRMASSLDGKARMRLYSFARTAIAESDWTMNGRDIETAARRLQPDGNTALFNVLDVASMDLAKQTGERAIVVFSDGKDSIGGAQPNSTITRCREQDIRVHAVALQTPELQVEQLQQFTSATHGQLLLITDPKLLIDGFEKVIAELTRPLYRITTLQQNVEDAAAQIDVGSNPISVQVPRPQTTATLAGPSTE